MKANLPPVHKGNVLGSSRSRSIKAPLTMFLVFLLASTMALRGNATHADTGHASNNVAETLLEMLNVTREEVNALLLSAGNNSSRVEDFVELLAEAEALNSEAHACLESGKYDLAVDTATEALNVYGRIASRIYAIEEEEEKLGGEDESVELVEHYARFEKALDRLNRYEEITDELASQGLDVSDVLILILYAERLLSEMREGLEREDFMGAESMRRDFEDAFEKIEDMLQSRSHEKRREKAERFVDETRDRVQRLETRYGQALDNQGIVDNATGGVHEELLDILSELEEVNAMIGEGELDEAIGRLENTIIELKHLGNDQDRLGEELIESLNSLGEQSFLHRSYEGRIRRLEGFGVDTVELDELLKEIRRLLIDAGREIEIGRNDEAEDLIKGSGELLEVLGTQIKKLQEELDESQGDDADHEAREKEAENEEYTDEHKEVNGTDKDDPREEPDEDLNKTKRDRDERDTEAGEEISEDVKGDENEEKEEDLSNGNGHGGRYFKVWLEKMKEKRAAYNRSRDKAKNERRNVTELLKFFKKTWPSSENREESGDDEEPRASAEGTNEAVEGSEEAKEKESSEEEDEEEVKDGKIEEEERDTGKDLEENSEVDELEEERDTKKNGPDEKSMKPEEKQEDGEGIEDDKPTEKSRKSEEKLENTENDEKEETNDLEDNEEKKADDVPNEKSRKPEKKPEDTESKEKEDKPEVHEPRRSGKQSKNRQRKYKRGYLLTSSRVVSVFKPL